MVIVSDIHITGYMTNTESNPDIPGPCHWQGPGNPSVTSKLLDSGIKMPLTDTSTKQRWKNGRKD